MAEHSRKTIFLTGASGNLGYETFKMLKESGRYSLRLLVLPDRQGLRRLQPYSGDPDTTVIWGDLTRYRDVKRAVGNADIILHMGAVIPPAADRHPEMARSVNYGGTLNIIRALEEQPEHEDTALVFIGTVAQSGNRLPPVHWERVGDPIMISRDDAYAESKVMAERAVIESGLSHWVSLRQTAMLYNDLFLNLDPIIYHHPLETHMEWVTVTDSARALFTLCEQYAAGTLPRSFWQQVYNIGGGELFRKTNTEFMQKAFSLLGIRDFRKVVNPNWFATENFHGCWFLDSGKLDDILHYRQDTFEGFFLRAEKLLSRRRRFLRTLTRLTPPLLIKYLVMYPLAFRPQGTLRSLRNNILEGIETFWGKTRWRDLPKSWRNMPIAHDPPARKILHGYNETKETVQLNLEDMRQAAEFRGGSCLSVSMQTGNINEKLQWECSTGHRFSASPRLVLRTGHWCPYCDIDSRRYQELGSRNRFLGQVTADRHRNAGRKLITP